MRAFIVFCLIAVASADVSHLSGYNYGGGHHDSHGGHSGGGGGDGGLFGGDAAGSHVAPTFSSDGAGASEGEYQKEFYTYSADETDFEQPEASEQVSNSLKQSLRVIFIKGPENKALENAALQLAQHASEQKTAIYVLNKQTDIGDLAQKLNSASSHNQNKPEVHFVKYRTEEDAKNAQSQIQNQYSSLGGPSQSHDGGVAPVLDFASKSHNGGHHGGSGGHGGSAGHGGYSHGAPSNTYVPPPTSPRNSYIPPAPPSTSYIPPSIFRRFRL